MKSLLNRWFGRAPQEREYTTTTAPQPARAPSLILRPDTTFPIVDWDAMDAQAPQPGDAALLDAFWTAAARTWLEQLAAALESTFTVRESDRFILLSPTGTGTRSRSSGRASRGGVRTTAIP